MKARAQRARASFGLALAAALAISALGATSASATFHLMSVREVYPGSAANPGSEYIELQMYSPGQNLVGGHVLRTYDAFGAVVKANIVPADVAGEANQSTVLLVTPQAEAEFGVVGDAALSPSGQLDPAAGAVCWETIDCVSWGGFAGSLPSPAGSPAAAVPDGMALRRTIAPGCPTLLEFADDRNNSAVDFSAVFPGPRPNSAAPSEHPCGASGGGGGGGGAESVAGAPQTSLSRRPAKRTRDRTPTFRFDADQPGSTFQCKLDRKPFRSCRSPFTAKALAVGRHTFAVRALDHSGKPDPTPAAYAFNVTRKPRPSGR